jgi:hypothetical protein
MWVKGDKGKRQADPKGEGERRFANTTGGWAEELSHATPLQESRGLDHSVDRWVPKPSRALRRVLCQCSAVMHNCWCAALCCPVADNVGFFKEHRNSVGICFRFNPRFGGYEAA